MALGAVSTYVPTNGFIPNLYVALLIFLVINIVTVFIWTAFGFGLRRFLDRPATLRAFNVGMALLLVGSLVPLLSELASKR